MKSPHLLWRDIAYRFAQQSRCRSRQVGAILVNEAGHLVGQGWNGAPEGTDCSTCRRCNEGCPSGTKLEWAVCAHAEANLLGHCARAGIATAGCHLIVTTRPCSECAKLIVAAGIKQVTYFEGYERNDSAVDVLRAAGITVLQRDQSM